MKGLNAWTRIILGDARPDRSFDILGSTGFSEGITNELDSLSCDDESRFCIICARIIFVVAISVGAIFPTACFARWWGDM